MYVHTQILSREQGVDRKVAVIEKVDRSQWDRQYISSVSLDKIVLTYINVPTIGRYERNWLRRNSELDSRNNNGLHPVLFHSRNDLRIKLFRAFEFHGQKHHWILTSRIKLPPTLSFTLQNITHQYGKIISPYILSSEEPSTTLLVLHNMGIFCFIIHHCSSTVCIKR